MKEQDDSKRYIPTFLRPGSVRPEVQKKLQEIDEEYRRLGGNGTDSLLELRERRRKEKEFPPVKEVMAQPKLRLISKGPGRYPTVAE